MQRIEGYLQSVLILLVGIAATLGVLMWGSFDRGRSSTMGNSAKLQQKYKEIYDRVQYGMTYQEVDTLVRDRLRVYCHDNTPETDSSTRWCNWQGAPTLTLSIAFNEEKQAIEKKLYYDKELGLRTN